LVLPGKSSTTEVPFDKRAQTCGVSAFFNREEHLTNPGMSVISPGNKAFKKSSCTRRTAFSRTAKFLARVDLPAAIFPQKNINFAAVLMLLCAWIADSALEFLASTAKVRPRHCFQTSLRNGPLADLTHPVSTLLDPSQGLIDRPRQTSISPVQTDLKLGLCIGVGLVNHISRQAACRWHTGVTLTQGRRQLVLFLQQQTVKSLEVCGVHDPSSVGGTLPMARILHPHETRGVSNDSLFGSGSQNRFAIKWVPGPTVPVTPLERLSVPSKVQAGDESAQRQDPCRGETAGTNGNADGRSTKPVTQGKSQIDAADQGQRCRDADGKQSDSGPRPDRKRSK
jgi:hypothetical protein